jgi:NADPH:quinone reductase-like Zn-dependent oxidoreductase
MKAVVFEQHGEPGKVLQMRDVPLGDPGPGQVRVRMLCSPINPSDLLVVRGRYGTLPNLPATPGFEGVGVVEAYGGGLYGKLMMGKRVAVLNRRAGNWCEQVVIPATEAFPYVPRSLPDEQVATLFVNPATAWIMVTDVLKVPRGAFLLQTAAGSALGKMVIRLGKHLGFQTINVVRRQDTAEQLKKVGAEHIINTAQEDLAERIADITQGKGVLYAIDAVGGDTGAKVLDCLGTRGRMLVYGALEDKPIAVSSRALIMGSRMVEGFWLADWVRHRSPLKMLFLLRKVGKLIAQGILTTEIAATFPLDRISEAVKAAETPGRQGKILLKMSETKSIMNLKV